MKRLFAFRRDERASTVMGRLGRGYRIGELRRIARHFSALDWADERLGHFQDKEVPRLSGQWGPCLES
jgi:hypothetical protein